MSRRCRYLLLVAGLLVLALYGFGGRLLKAVPDLGLPLIILYLVLEDITTPEVTAEEIKAVYAVNRDVMMSIVGTCQRYPRINRVRAAERPFYDESVDFYGEGAAEPELLAAVDSIRTRMALIPATRVVCWKRRKDVRNPLTSVSFTIYSVGWVLGGELKRISYKTEWSRVREEQLVVTEEEMEMYYGYIKLPDEGWYIFVSK